MILSYFDVIEVFQNENSEISFCFYYFCETTFFQYWKGEYPEGGRNITNFVYFLVLKNFKFFIHLLLAAVLAYSILNFLRNWS